jgi:uncharacterized membrane protein
MPAPSVASGPDPVARAVLFYSPQCVHCHELLRDHLPPILNDYGDRLQILAGDAADPEGAALLRAAAIKYDVPPEKRGVPAVIIGDHFLAGTTDISEQLPMLAAEYLSAGGVGWSAVPGLSRATSASGAVVTSSPSRLLAVTQPANGILDRLARDRWGNTIALILLAGMLAAVGVLVARSITAFRTRRAWWSTAPAEQPSRGWRVYGGIALIALGLGITSYLSYAALTDATLLCGPLGACDVVQQSTYARLFGALPVAYVGLAGYLLIGAACAGSVLGSGTAARAGALAVLALTLCGTLFSIYLTTLEPFVLGATCIWCLGSAASMTLLLLLSADRIGLRGRATQQHDATHAASSAV